MARRDSRRRVLALVAAMYLFVFTDIKTRDVHFNLAMGAMGALVAAFTLVGPGWIPMLAGAGSMVLLTGFELARLHNLNGAAERGGA
ncbi:hypothetical protein DVA67_033035 [Solirubrobacter sp. CPCC 204708]|uniref:Uncharacterized protein n=1 Tax=Solirubrobacter deserti TaxID=2282478 RepID=A0ABT4RIT7_9ACTN|nr:hypothetical protein [Solirubrobacter deserti]MBE2320831.1 hypothetical protein [Solirubrobacter deserti]MDA0138465.1 hypothetical protein [Solirubrobacter deserti]